MSAYQQQEYDFINRTKDILKQYENFKIKDKEKYEVTLLLNCFVGLLIIPQQYWMDHLPNDLISEKEWGIKPEHISKIQFKDKRGGTITFEASIPLGNLRSFMDKFSSYMLKVMEEKY